MHAIRRWSLAGVLVLFPACGSGGSKGNDELPSLELLSKNIVDALCENQLECPIAYDDQLFTSALFVQREGEAVDNCRAYHGTAKTTERLTRYQQAQQRGGLEIDRARLSRLSSCQLPSEDDSWLVGKVPPGQPCQLHAECQGGYCDTSAACPGVCVARRADGAACDSSWQCLSGACDDVCVRQPLTAGAGEGQACASEGSSLVLCSQGLWCNEDSGTCEKPIAAGAACDDDDDVCVAGHFCVATGADRGATASRRCLPLRVQPLGAACDLDGASGDSFRVCDLIHVDACVDGTCVHYPEGKAGDPCNRTEMADTCAAGLACDWFDWVCVPLLENGASCSSGGECRGRCNFRTGRCESAEPFCEEPL